VRGHMRASSAESTQRRATGLGSVLRARLAAAGSGAPSLRLAGLLVLATAALLALWPTLAQANYAEFSSFGAADSNNPVGVAVDQSNHDVYVGNLFNAGADKYDAQGNRLAPPSPFDLAGSQTLSGVAVNPTNQQVYIIDAGNQTIDTFDPTTGAQLSSFSIAGSANFFGAFTVVQLATDAAGNVYLPNAPNNEVQEFDSSGTLLKTFTGSGAEALSEPTGVAVDSSGDVWVADTANNRIEEFNPAGTAVLSAIASTGVQAVAVDSSGDVFASVTDGSGSHVIEYDSSGTQIDDFGTGQIGTSGFGTVNTLSVDDSNGNLYVADGGNNLIWIFGPQSAPIISEENVTEVSADGATLGANINPANADTTYHFQYGTADCSANPCASVPIPDADIGTGTAVRSVSQQIQGLTAGTTYHYRVIATNSLGTTKGPDRSFTTQSPPQVEPDTCPNAAIRTQQGSSFLPDCRAYEQVTPIEKGSGALPLAEATFNDDGIQASIDGERIAYSTINTWPGAQSGSDGYYVASRTPSGWSNLDLIPPLAQTENTLVYPRIAGYSADLSNALLEIGGGSFTAFGQDDPPLDPGEPPDNINLFRHQGSDGSWQLMNPTPGTAKPANTFFDGASADGNRIIFSSGAKLTPDAVDFATALSFGDHTGFSRNVYEWENGSLSLISQIPTAPATECGITGPVCSAAPGGGTLRVVNSPGTRLNTVSTDASKVFFGISNPGFAFQDRSLGLFVRENGTKTVKYSASQKTNGSGPGGTDANGPGTPNYWFATPDGAEVFFSSCEQLTNDSTAVSLPESKCLDSTPATGTGSDLYRYDTDTGALTDLTVDHNPGDSLGADLRGVLGISSDGSTVYLVAHGVLAAGATAGQPNLYLWRNGTTTFITTLDEADSRDWQNVGREEFPEARVSADGNYVAFDSVRSLTGYDNTVASGPGCGTDPVSGQPLPRQCVEIFEYNANTNQLDCASCNPTGARPLGPSRLESVETAGTGSSDFLHLLNNLTDTGRLFFNSQDALVPRDTNGDTQDVYEYDGAPHLLSRGTGSYPSTFFDASASGSDVFFDTTASLVPGDQGQVLDLYDARVGGGFQIPSEPIACQGDNCQQPAVPPVDRTPSSLTFNGPGNAHHTHHKHRHKHGRRHRNHHHRRHH
jgi:DNA-binding beta-propeller fold protein YncE